MRIGTSRADRIGFAVVVVLASVLAVLLFNGLGNDSTESAQEVSTFADLPEPTAVPTTLAVTMPAPTATPTPDPTPLPIEPLAAPEDDDAETDAEEAADDSSTADGNGTDDGTTSSATASAAPATTAPAPAPAPAPQPAHATPTARGDSQETVSLTLPAQGTPLSRANASPYKMGVTPAPAIPPHDPLPADGRNPIDYLWNITVVEDDLLEIQGRRWVPADKVAPVQAVEAPPVNTVCQLRH